MELLVRQVLNLDRPWRERRDMLSGILSAASVEDRQQVMKNLDQRFDVHAEIDDFEIAPRLGHLRATFEERKCLEIAKKIPRNTSKT